MSILKLLLNSNKSFCGAQSFNKSFTLCRTFAATPQKENLKSKEWEPIYKFRYIQSLASVNKTKILVAAFTGLAVPVSFITPIIEPLVVASVGVSLVTTLAIVSYAFRNTVGFMYTNQRHPDKVKFAYLDFWGTRKDVEMKIEDVIPFSELQRSVFDPWFTILQFYSGHHQMKLFYKFGGVSDVNEFSKVFGLEQ